MLIKNFSIQLTLFRHVCFRFISISLLIQVGINLESSEKIREIPGGNTASMFQIFLAFPCRIRWLSCIFPARSCEIRWQERSTWVIVIQLGISKLIPTSINNKTQINRTQTRGNKVCWVEKFYEFCSNKSHGIDFFKNLSTSTNIPRQICDRHFL